MCRPTEWRDSFAKLCAWPLTDLLIAVNEIDSNLLLFFFDLQQRCMNLPKTIMLNIWNAINACFGVIEKASFRPAFVQCNINCFFDGYSFCHKQRVPVSELEKACQDLIFTIKSNLPYSNPIDFFINSTIIEDSNFALNLYSF